MGDGMECRYRCCLGIDLAILSLILACDHSFLCVNKPSISVAPAGGKGNIVDIQTEQCAAPDRLREDRFRAALRLFLA
jgi:hypothetical protein